MAQPCCLLLALWNGAAHTGHSRCALPLLGLNGLASSHSHRAACARACTQAAARLREVEDAHAAKLRSMAEEYEQRARRAEEQHTAKAQKLEEEWAGRLRAVEEAEKVRASRLLRCSTIAAQTSRACRSINIRHVPMLTPRLAPQARAELSKDEAAKRAAETEARARDAEDRMRKARKRLLLQMSCSRTEAINAAQLAAPALHVAIRFCRSK